MEEEEEEDCREEEGRRKAEENKKGGGGWQWSIRGGLGPRQGLGKSASKEEAKVAWPNGREEDRSSADRRRRRWTAEGLETVRVTARHVQCHK